MKRNFGAYLRDLRIKAGYKMDEVVVMSNRVLDKTTLSRAERNERGLSLDKALFLSKIYEVPLEEIAEQYYGKAVKIKPYKPIQPKKTG